MQGDGDAGSTAGYLKWEADAPTSTPAAPPLPPAAGLSPPSVPLLPPNDSHGAAADDPVIDVGGTRSSPSEARPPSRDALLVGLRRDLERIGIEAVEWADKAADALRAEAEVEAAQIKADAVRRSDRLLREVDRARSALRSEARLAAARIWETARNPNASLAETIQRADSAFGLPLISWQSDEEVPGRPYGEAPEQRTDVPPPGTCKLVDNAKVSADLAKHASRPSVPSPSVLAGDPASSATETAEPAPAAATDTGQVAGTGLEPMAAAAAGEGPEVLAPQPMGPVAVPGPEPDPVAEVPPAVERSPRKWTRTVVWSLLGLIVVAAIAFALTRSSNVDQPRLTPTTTVSPAAANVDIDRMYSRWVDQFALLAPVGGDVRQQGPLQDQQAATGQADQLQQALAMGRIGGYSGGFTGESGGAGKQSSGREVANASFSRYATPQDASTAFDAIRKFALGDAGTSAGSVEVALPRSLALRSFAYRMGQGPSRSYIAVLEFPAGVVQLNTTARHPEALDAMVAVTSSWAR